jgi:hypothetical protein
MPFKITDDSRFVPVIDPNAYRGPVHAARRDDEGGETFSLIWSRGRRSNSD